LTCRAGPRFLGLLGFLIEALVFQFAGLFFGSFHPLLGLLDVFIRGGCGTFIFSALIPPGGGVDE